jgi:peptidoglycan-associated lipoprotein
MHKHKLLPIVLASSLLMVAAGCKKKFPAAAPPPVPKVQAAAPPRPSPKTPTISRFVAEPSTIERGQAATLGWSTADATGASIEPGVGMVPVNGSRQVYPTIGVTYTLSVTGPGGHASATTTVRVSTPPSAPPPPPTQPKITFGETLGRDTRDALFDFDKSDLRPDARAALTKDADALKRILRDFNNENVVVEGHCDERGSAEYNLGLGDRRAKAAQEYLVEFGVPANRLRAVSYGKERPQCTESNEECWQKNRRAHLSPQ